MPPPEPPIGPVHEGLGDGTPPPVCPWPPLAQELPKAGFAAPGAFTVSPQTLTGTSTGTCTALPDPSPGEPCAPPWARPPEPPPEPLVSPDPADPCELPEPFQLPEPLDPPDSPEPPRGEPPTLAHLLP